MVNFGKLTLVLISLLLSFGCAPKENLSQKGDPDLPNKPANPDSSSGTSDSAGGLKGSTWMGEGSSSDEPYLHTYIFRFSKEFLKIEVSCKNDSGNLNLTVEAPIVYTENGNVATMKTGVQSSVPLGAQTCSVLFPANLEFHLENGATIFLIHNGVRQNTQLKKMN
ncbi:MAG: hypothetical protein ACXVCP_17670 [Bdellovibrio sp.]